MKKLLVTMLLTAIASSMLTATVCKIKTNNYINGLYPRTGIVTEINYKEDKVTVKCANGNPYYFYGVSDYVVGDIVSLIAKQNNTEVVTDDKVVSHRYDGFIELLEQIK